MKSHLVAGLDIGTTKTCAVLAEVPADPRQRHQLQVVGVGQARTEGMKSDVVTHIDETAETVRAALREAEVMAGVSVDRVYAGIAGAHIQTGASLGVVAVGGEEIGIDDVERVHEVARAVALPPDRELLHALPQDYVVDHQGGIVDPVGMTATRLEADVYLVTCGAQAAGNLRKAVSKAGYRVQELVLEPLASARAVLTEDEKEVGVAMIEIGAGTTDIAVFHEGKLRHVSILPLGGTTVTNDLVRGLSVPFAEAQRAKETHGIAVSRLTNPQETVELPGPGPGQVRQVARELIAHIVEQRLDELLGLVQQELESLRVAERLGAGVVLTGGTAAMPGMLELAGQVFAAPARIGAPGEGLSGMADAVARPRFATAAGLALRASDRFHETGEGSTTRASGMVSRVGAWLREFF
ncbi:MAG: cell division protein FtsA [Gemmatimonadetes bacterium]|nr:cell division protein FtsA [Gemmatimonadota bacterium]